MMGIRERMIEKVAALAREIYLCPYKWLKDEIWISRFLQLKEDEWNLASDAEALAYLYPRTMEAPMDHDWTEIYIYLGTLVMESNHVNAMAFPENLRVVELSGWQQDLLRRLKIWIRERTKKHVKEANRERKKGKIEKTVCSNR